MNTQSPITLCLIVKNESRYIRKCIESVLPIVSAVVVVDTGSTDDTAEIASAYTEQVHFHPFNQHFSNARNHALKYAKTPWVLFLDADECFEPQDAEALLQTILAAPPEHWGYKVTRYNFFGTGGWYTSKKLKLFRNRPDIFYEGAVSESVNGSIKRGGGEMADAPVLLNHFGHCRSIGSRNQKAHFYLDLMLQEIVDEPNNSRLMGYAAMILRTLGRFEEALELSRKAIAISPESAHVHYCRAQVLRSIERPKEALQEYAEAASLEPDDPATWNMIGVIQMSLGDYPAAKTSFNKTLALNPLLIHAKVNLGLLAQAEENWDEAYRQFSEVAFRNPGFLHEDFATRFECDPYREFYYETIFKYAGLNYHLSFAKEKVDHAALSC